MAFKSSGKLEQDIKDIAIKQLGGDKAYNALDSDAKKKIDSYKDYIYHKIENLSLFLKEIRLLKSQ